ncbi:hypothetical protein C8J56DRAFT_810204, partial [Mycena floridula]
VPTFGRDTIRHFHNNVSKLKKFAGHDFEDVLQCAIPCFEDLLPEPHNTIVLDLLWDFSTYHAYAKLRLQTDSTIFTFRLATRYIGQSLRRFYKVTCAAL